MMLLQNTCLLLILLFTLSCSRFQPELEVLEYGSRLPNYCVNDFSALDILEINAREYGSILAEQGVIGEWDGLLHSLILQHFLWSHYEAVVRIGDRYADYRDASVLPEYVIAKYLSGGYVEPNLIKDSPYQVLLTSEIRIVAENMKNGFEGVEDAFSFREWANDPQGLYTILVLVGRLHKGQMTSSNEQLVVDTLIPLFIKGEPLDRFLRFANEGAPWGWNSWLKSSLILEQYFEKSGAHSLLDEIRNGRKYIGEQMAGTKYEQHWVKCIQRKSGLFQERKKGAGELN